MTTPRREGLIQILLRTAGLFAMLEVELMVDEDNYNNSNKRKGLKK
jgi:hypothetical protein